MDTLTADQIISRLDYFQTAQQSAEQVWSLRENNLQVFSAS